MADLTRRRVLQLLGTGGVVATAGCTSYLPWVSDEGPEEEPDNESESDPEWESNESEGEGEDGDTAESTDENESVEENETDAEPEPESENETVEESTRPETVKIDDAVDADINFDRQPETGVAVWGEVTNTTTDPIDQVTVIVRLYDGDGNVIFEQTDGVIGLDGLESWEFEFVTRDTDIARQCESYDIEVIAEQHT